jgi:glycosyltransferase involved in cell wall biosynthesis
MEKNPFFTIVTPTYNRAYIISKTIKSVIAQSFDDFEFIVVDDGSTDNTKEVVEGFNDKRIIYIKLPTSSGGPCHPRNVGFEKAIGEYVVLLDSDDELDKDILKTYKEWIEKKPQMKVFLMDTINEDENKLRSGSSTGDNLKKQRTFTYEDMICGRCTGDYIFCIKKEVVKKIKFPEGFKRNYNFQYKVAKENDFFYIPKIGLYIASHRTTGKDRLTTTIEKNALAFVEWVDDYLHLFGEDTLKICPQYMERWYREKGVLYILANNRKEGIKYLLKGLKYKPLSYKTWIYIVCAIFFPNLIKWRVGKMV